MNYRWDNERSMTLLKPYLNAITMQRRLTTIRRCHWPVAVFASLSGNSFAPVNLVTFEGETLKQYCRSPVETPNVFDLARGWRRTLGNATRLCLHSTKHAQLIDRASDGQVVIALSIISLHRTFTLCLLPQSDKATLLDDAGIRHRADLLCAVFNNTSRCRRPFSAV